MKWYAARLVVCLCPAAGLAAVFSASTLYGDSTMASHEYYVAGFGDAPTDRLGPDAGVFSKDQDRMRKKATPLRPFLLMALTSPGKP